MSRPNPIPGLTSEQQSALYRKDIALYEAGGFVYAFEPGGEMLRVAFMDSPDHATHAVLMPTSLALDLARMILRAVALPHKPLA